MFFLDHWKETTWGGGVRGGVRGVVAKSLKCWHKLFHAMCIGNFSHNLLCLDHSNTYSTQTHKPPSSTMSYIQRPQTGCRV